MNYKQRMINELLELNVRIVRLQNFDRLLTEEQAQMIDKQLKAMTEYFDILKERIMAILEDKKTIASK